MEKENNEMDLLDLIRKVIDLVNSYLKYAFTLLLKIIKFHVRSFVYLLTFISLGVGATYYLTQDENTRYNADFMMQVNGTNSYAVADIVDVLSQSIDKETNVRFAKALNVPESVVKNVKGVESFFVIDLNNNRTRDYVDYNNSFVEDTLNSRMQNFLAIRIKTKGSANFKLLQNGIIKYLRSDEYLKREELERIKVIKNAISAIDVEIQTLDRMRLTETSDNGANLALLDKGVVRETTYYQDMIDLKARRTHLYEELNLQRDVVTIYSGVKMSTVYSDKKILISFLALAYVLAMLLSLVVHFRKQIAKAIF